MPAITDPIPDAVKADLVELRGMLDQAIPHKVLDKNLLIGTWNIRAFGGLTEKWRADEHDSPKRDLHALACIAEIVSRFDVVAIQEVKGDLKALRHLLKYLERYMGMHWGVMLTDVTRGHAGNGERLAFLYDRRRANPSGLACELVVPDDSDGIAADALQRQFARTPYAVSFRIGDTTFILVTLHVVYGEDAADRVPELRAIAEWMAGWARDVHAYNHNLIVLGDFNIDRAGDPLYQAFTSTGLVTAPGHEKLPRTIFSKPGKRNFFDQVAWFTDAGQAPALSMVYHQAGNFDFVDHVLAGQELSLEALSWRISDHRPLWVEFRL
jgi:Endonuclease/Exonuclease/phosphatase family.